MHQSEVGVAYSGTEQGGSGCTDIGADLLGGGTISTALRFIYMGTDPTDVDSAGRIPP